MDKAIKFVIIDLDDTLLYTSEYNTMLYCDALYQCSGISLHALIKEQGVRITATTIRAIFADCSLLSPKAVEQIVERTIELKRAMASSTLGKERESLLRLNSHALELLARYKDAEVVLLTNADKARAMYLYRLLALERIVGSLYCNPNPIHNKYAYIRGLLDLDPKVCLVLENEEEQIRLAIEAGFEPRQILHMV